MKISYPTVRRVEFNGKKKDNCVYFFFPFYDLFGTRHCIQYIVYYTLTCTYARTFAIYCRRSNNIDCALPSLGSAVDSEFSFFLILPRHHFSPNAHGALVSVGPINRPNRFLAAGFTSRSFMARGNERRNIIMIFYGYVIFVGSCNVSLTCH